MIFSNNVFVLYISSHCRIAPQPNTGTSTTIHTRDVVDVKRAPVGGLAYDVEIRIYETQQLLQRIILATSVGDTTTTSS